MARIVSLLILLIASPAAAEKPSVAVLDIQGTGVEPTLLPTLTEVLTVEVDNLGLYKVIAGRDVQAMLGFEAQKDVVGCTDAACLAEIGGALGVERIVASHIGMVGSTYVVNIKLINIREADTESRIYETVKGDADTLITTIRKSVDKLLGAGSKAAAETGAVKAKPATTASSGGTSSSSGSTTTPTEPPPTVEKSGGGGGIGILPIALWAGGGVLLGVGGFFGMQAKGHESDANETLPDNGDVYAPGAQIAAEDAAREAMFANIFIGLGVAAIGGGVVAWLLGGSSDDAKTAMVPVVGPDQAGIAFTGTF